MQSNMLMYISIFEIFNRLIQVYFYFYIYIILIKKMNKYVFLSEYEMILIVYFFGFFFYVKFEIIFQFVFCGI